MYSQLQPINVQKSVNKPTVGAIHELPLPWYANMYIELFCQKLQLAKLIDLLIDL